MGTTSRIIGVDPGYATIGYGVVDYEGSRFNTVEYGAIQTSPKLPFEHRLGQIYNELTAVLQRTKPRAMALEKLFFGNNKTTGIDVAQARGVIQLCAFQNMLEVAQYTPAQVKQAVVGYGNAEKNQVMQMVRLLLGLSAIPRPDDTADALAVAICHAHTGGSRIPLQNLQRAGR